jgi:hypothetical protein
LEARLTIGASGAPGDIINGTFARGARFKIAELCAPPPPRLGRALLRAPAGLVVALAASLLSYSSIHHVI